MRKNRLFAVLAVLLLLLSSVSLFSGCAPTFSTAPILSEEADVIEAELDALLAAKAEALSAQASRYEATGEVLTNENGDPIDMTAHIASLKEKAKALGALTYRPYTLAIMDYLYAHEYIGEYKSLSSLLPQMVDILADYAILDRLTDDEKTTEALIACYTMALGDIYASYVDSAAAKEEEEMPTSYVGIGASVTPRDDG